MKKIILTSFSLIVFGFLLFTNSAFATDAVSATADIVEEEKIDLKVEPTFKIISPKDGMEITLGDKIELIVANINLSTPSIVSSVKDTPTVKPLVLVGKAVFLENQDLFYNFEKVECNEAKCLVGTWDTKEVKEGKYEIVVSDAENKYETSVVVAVVSPVVLDTTAPVITLNGNNPVTIYRNESYEDAGATATDNVNGAVFVTTVNPVNTSTIDVYTITYTAKDSANNTATATRTVNVIRRPSSSSGSYISRLITPNAGEGRVLGAEKFIFTLPLKLGSRGNEVTELHKRLIADGYLKIAAPTGYFGPLTLQAVKDFQTAKLLVADGVVGPLTRAELNK